MVVTTMPSIQSLVNKLSALYPNYQWQVADKFAWNPASKTISYISGGSHAQLLHELGHAELRHDTYARDIELLRLERAAWTKAETIATDLGLTILKIQSKIISIVIVIGYTSAVPALAATPQVSRSTTNTIAA